MTEPNRPGTPGPAGATAPSATPSATPPPTTSASATPPAVPVSTPTATATATAQIDARLAAMPADQRAALQALRETIAAAAPDAEETISYGMPAFRYHGRALVSFDGFKAHCSFFPMGSEVTERHAAELVDFVTSKGTLRFTPDRPIPADVVATIVRERMAQIDAKGKRR